MRNLFLRQKGKLASHNHAGLPPPLFPAVGPFVRPTLYRLDCLGIDCLRRFFQRRNALLNAGADLSVLFMQSPCWQAPAALCAKKWR
eukprot:3833566-Amphidinium_carterae.1